jgi:hypothetical protein
MWLKAQVVERPAHVAVEVNLDRTGEDHSAMNFRIALKADAASVNFGTSCGSLAMLAAIRLASSRVSTLSVFKTRTTT